MQLEVFTAPTHEQARRTSQNIEHRIRILLAESADLRVRVETLECDIEEAARKFKAATCGAMLQGGCSPKGKVHPENQPRFSWTHREFEQVLALSRVYQRGNRHGSEILDFDSSMLLNYSLSDMSLSNISLMSVIALPILVSEVDEERQWYTEYNLQTIQQTLRDDSKNHEEEIGRIEGLGLRVGDHSLLAKVRRAFDSDEDYASGNALRSALSLLRGKPPQRDLATRYPVVPGEQWRTQTKRARNKRIQAYVKPSPTRRRETLEIPEGPKRLGKHQLL